MAHDGWCGRWLAAEHLRDEERWTVIGTRGKSLRGRRVLVVEDEYMIASDMATMLVDEGAEVLGPFPTVKEAITLLASGARPDGALIDVNLQGAMVWPLVDLLLAGSVPVVLATGYDSATIPRVYAGLPLYEKPVETADLARALARRIAAG